MIIWILLIALIITAAAILLGGVFGRLKNKAYRKTIYIGVAVCVALITFCMVLGGIYHNEVSDLQAQYDDIMLYHEVVSNCDNEQVRFGHYEKIEDFNAEYDRLAVAQEDFMFGTLFPKNWSEHMGLIEFYFRGVSYEPVYD